MMTVEEKSLRNEIEDYIFEKCYGSRKDNYPMDEILDDIFRAFRKHGYRKTEWIGGVWSD